MSKVSSRESSGYLQLLRDETVFSSILENLNSGVALINDQGRFCAYNRKFLKLFGLSEESTIKNVNDQNWAAWQVFNEDLEILHVDDHPVRKAALTGSSIRNQLVGVILPSGGDIIWMLISAEPIFDNEGRIEKTICTYLDITEHKLADAALRRSEQRLREMNATKDKLFSIISHDLKSPFSSIVGFSELLAAKLEKGDLKSAENYAKIILESSWHAMDLLNNLIEWSRIQSGRLTFNPSSFDLVSILHEVVNLLKASARQKSIDISLETPARMNLFADKAMIGVVFRNLITNSIKFTDTGGNIKINASENSDAITVEVIDNGVGMSKAALENLLSLNPNVSTPGTLNETGTGLGMIICREFIAKHGGKIEAISEPGKGSTFRTIIPS